MEISAHGSPGGAGDELLDLLVLCSHCWVGIWIIVEERCCGHDLKGIMGRISPPTVLSVWVGEYQACHCTDGQITVLG